MRLAEHNSLTSICSSFAIDISLAKRLLRLGMPVMFQDAIIRIGGMVLQQFLPLVIRIKGRETISVLSCHISAAVHRAGGDFLCRASGMVGGLCAADNCILQKHCIFQNIKCV